MLSVAITSVSTLLAPILTPALILLLAGKWLSVSAGALFWSIVKVVLIPIILGLIVQMMFQKQVKASVQILPLVSVIAIVAIVAAVVGLNQQAIAKSGFIIFLAVVVHNGFGLLLGYWFAKLFRMSEPKQKAISIEVGMQILDLALHWRQHIFRRLSLFQVRSSAFGITSLDRLWPHISVKKVKDKKAIIQQLKCDAVFL